MGECNHYTPERALAVEEDGVSVAFHRAVTHDNESRFHGDQEEGERGDGLTEETVHLRTKDGDAEEARGSTGSGKLQESGEKETLLCLPAFCARGEKTASSGEVKTPDGMIDSYSPKLFPTVTLGAGPEKPKRCPGVGLFYAFLSTVLFSIIALLVKTIEDIHSIEISAIRCFFQMLFVIPLLIYHKIGFLGPRDKRIYLVLRGFLGSNAMILLYYAVQQMPLADATVIMFREKCTIWDCVFTLFTLTGVILIARPPFLFGEHPSGIEGNYTNHVKGTVAAFGGAIGAAFTFVVLRKMGKSVHYYLSVWYYAVIGLIESLITVSILGEWKLPFCGRDRWILMLIAILGIAGQTFLTKALQLEKAGPVALMRTVDVVLAFFFQFVFFNRAPTWWSLGGALCVVLSTSGVAFRKWYSSSRRS